MPSYNLGRAVGTIRIVYNSSGTAAAQRDVASLESRLDLITNKAVKINLEDAEAQRRVDVIAAQLDALSSDVANPEVELSDEQFRIKFRAIEDMMDQLNLDNADPNVNIHINPKEYEQLSSLKAAMERLDGDTADVRVRVSTQLANAQLAETQAAVNHLDGQTITIHTRLDKSLSRLQGFLTGLIGVVGKTTLYMGILAGAIELVTAAVAVLSPVVATLIGVLGVFAALMVASLAGLALLGAAAYVAFKPILDAKGDLTKLNAQQQQLVYNLKALGNTAKATAGTVNTQIYSIANTTLRTLNRLIPQLQPLLKGTADAVDNLAKRGEAAMNGPWTKRWIDFLTREGPQAVTFFGSFTGKLGAIIGNFLIGFEPLFKPAEDAMIGWANRVLESSRKLDKSKGWQNFLGFIRETAPLVGDALGRMASGLNIMLTALEPAAAPLLNFLGDFGDATGKIAQSSGFTEFIDGMNRAFSTLGTMLKDNADPIGTFLGSFSTALADLLQGLAPLIPHLLNFGTSLFRVIDNVVKNPNFVPTMEAIGRAVDSFGRALEKASKSPATGVFLTLLKDLALAISSLLDSDMGTLTVQILGLVAAMKLLGLTKFIFPTAGAGSAAGATAAARGGLGKIVLPVALALEVGATAKLTSQVAKEIGKGDWSGAFRDLLGGDIANALTGGISGFVSKGWKEGWQQALAKNPASKLIAGWLGQSGDMEGVWAPAGNAAQEGFWNGAQTPAGAKANGFLNTVTGAIKQPTVWNGVGGDSADSFIGGIISKTGNADAAGKALGSAGAAGAVGTVNQPSPFGWTLSGELGGDGFIAGITSKVTASETAGGALAGAAVFGTSPWWQGGKTQGTDGATGFWQGILSQTPQTAGAAGALAGAATSSSWWDGFGNGSDGGAGFGTGIGSAKGGVVQAAQSLALTAEDYSIVNLWSAGNSAGITWANGLAAAQTAAATAAAAVAAAAAAHFPGSPAKAGVFATPNDPESRGFRTAKSFAAGMLSGSSEIARAAMALSSTAVFGGSNAAMGALSSPGVSAATNTTNSKAITYAPVWQYVGPTPAEVAKQTQRDFDWQVGS